ncbi:MAG TPA: HAMP domain-containing sensor histidine kinase [Phycisphaerae bacterium]|nr:HAMP domain-containing sensor histidine kinase [Phycisphaerae bacterium]
MARISFFKISLAAKCRILFGLAVILIVGAALFVPWLRMHDLVHRMNIQLVLNMGRLVLARTELGAENWDLKQKALELWWPHGGGPGGGSSPVPRLVKLSDPLHPTPPPDADEFEKAAIATLLGDESLTELPARWDSSGGLVRYRMAFAVRSTGGQYPPGQLLGLLRVDYEAPRAHVDFIVNVGLSLMAGALAGILAILVFYLITQKLILSPVRELTQVAESVSQGDHSIRSAIATGDEYEELSRAFNAMLSHLEASENELKRINKSLDTRVAQLAERNVALFEADKLKSQFLSIVSHELRTPLASIIGFAELLREAASADGGRQYRYAENIMSSGRMLLGLINDLLDLAKIEAGKLELHLGAVNMEEMIRNLLDFIRPLADKKSLQLSAIIREAVPPIVSDSGRIQQILYNLLSNAVKFTPEGGLIEVTLERAGDDHVSIKVRDTGIGISQELLGGVFEKFRQIDGSMTREHSGTGLGLAISKELAIHLGGSISVTSEAGKGSEFTVILPATAPDVPDGARLPGINLAQR